MASRLPLDSEELLAASDVHEGWACELLDACEDFEAARLMLASPSFHWEHNVLQVKSSRVQIASLV